MSLAPLNSIDHHNAVRMDVAPSNISAAKVEVVLSIGCGTHLCALSRDRHDSSLHLTVAFLP